MREQHPRARTGLQARQAPLREAQVLDHLVGAGEGGGANVTLVGLGRAQEHGLDLAAVVAYRAQLHALPVHHGVGVGALVQAHVPGGLVGAAEALAASAALEGFARVDVHVLPPVALLDELAAAGGALVLPPLHLPVHVGALQVVDVGDVRRRRRAALRDGAAHAPAGGGHLRPGGVRVGG